MNRYTLTPEFIKAATEGDADHYLNVLMVFAQDNQYKLCMDDKMLAHDIYRTLVAGNECLLLWIGLLNINPSNIEKVSVPMTGYADERDLFLDIANGTPPEKKLVTSDKQLYACKQTFIQHNAITLLDGAQAKQRMAAPQVIVQMSLGNNSPNICGNHNQIEAT